MADVRVYVRDSELAAVEGALVKAKAIGSGSEPVFSNGGSTIVKEVAEHTSALGLVTLSLAANSTLLPANSYYRITIRVPGERKERKFDIQVPVGAGPFDVEDLLHDPGTIETAVFAAYRAELDNQLLNRVGAMLGPVTQTDDGLELQVTSPWGIDNGVPYYDSEGATEGEEAVLTVDPDGTWVIVQPEGMVV